MPDETRSEPPNEWFTEAFGELYPILYGHRDQGEAERLLAAIAVYGPFEAERVLDLACGEGRYLRALAKGKIEPVGLDLSMPLLLRARAAQRGVALVRADMRSIPLRTGCFDWVQMMFTSFGYFEEEPENRQVVTSVRSLLRHGGRFLIDTVNPPRLRETLVPASRRTVGEIVIEEERRMDEPRHRVIKQVKIGPLADGRTLSYEERVRLYDRVELEAILRSERFELLECLGDYDGTGYAEKSSPRLILLARTREDFR